MSVVLRSGPATVRVTADSAAAALRDAKQKFPGALKLEHSTSDHRAQ